MSVLNRLLCRHDDLHILKKLVYLPQILKVKRLDQLFAGRFQLAVCAIFKDEARYLDDWIGFHIAVGVDHFYLYDNESSDAPAGVLAKWINAGRVTLTRLPGEKQQMSAYRDCLRRFKMDARWIAFIDIDEFIYPLSGHSVPDLLTERFHDVSGLHLVERVFGSNQHVQKPKLHPGRAYVMRAPDRFSAHAKIIVNPRQVKRMSHPHDCDCWIGGTETTDGARRNARGRNPLPSNVIALNHYWARSRSELEEKAKRGDVYYGGPRSFERMLERESHLNAVFDDAICRILDWMEAAPGDLDHHVSSDR